MPEQPRPAPAGSVEQEVLNLLAVQARRVPFAVVIAAAVIAGLAYRAFSATVVLTWLSVVVAILVVRFFALGWLPRANDIPLSRRIHVAIALSAINGCAHGSALAFMSALPDFDRTVITITFMGLCAGSVVTTAGYRPVFLAYLLPMMAPLILFWAIGPSSDFQWRYASLALLCGLLSAVFVVLANDTQRLFRDSFAMRTEQLALNAQLEDALRESRAAGAAKTRFLAAASHDLRQPVHALTLLSAALSRKALGEDARTIAQHIESALDVLGSQLNALLDMSKLDAGVVTPNVTTFNVGSMLERVREQFAPLAEEKGLAHELDCDRTPRTATDEMLLERVVRNLVANAVRYTVHGRVLMSAHQADGEIELMVADTGIGISADDLPRVFEEFYQVDNPSRDRARGLGLGLAIAKRTVDLLGVPLTLESSLGAGTVCRLRIPRSSQAVDIAAELGAAPTLESLHVLAVDDEPDVLQGMRLLLESLHCSVEIATSTAAAIDTARKHEPDLVMCDFRLGAGDSGLATVRALRDLYPALPAILITGDTAPDRLREASAANLKLLHKPIGAKQLTAAIAEACLRRG